MSIVPFQRIDRMSPWPSGVPYTPWSGVSHHVSRVSPENRERKAAAMKKLFGPIELREGQFQVWGCSPGCLLVSVAVSIVLTILVNLLIEWIW
jgi:hypothetical protein